MCEEAVGWRMKMAEQNNQQKKGGQQDANQLIQVRYDKLHELEENGKNPTFPKKIAVAAAWGRGYTGEKGKERSG